MAQPVECNAFPRLATTEAQSGPTRGQVEEWLTRLTRKESGLLRMFMGPRDPERLDSARDSKTPSAPSGRCHGARAAA